MFPGQLPLPPPPLGWASLRVRVPLEDPLTLNHGRGNFVCEGPDIHISVFSGLTVSFENRQGQDNTPTNGCGCFNKTLFTKAGEQDLA